MYLVYCGYDFYTTSVSDDRHNVDGRNSVIRHW